MTFGHQTASSSNPVLSGPPREVGAGFRPPAFTAEALQNINLFASDAEQLLRQVLVPRSSRLAFQIDGVLFQATYAPEGDSVKLQIWAVLGYLPFSVESAQRRRMLIACLEGARYLRQAKFGINRENQIVALHTARLPGLEPPAFIFVPLITFVREAMPFIRLIGECL